MVEKRWKGWKRIVKWLVQTRLKEFSLECLVRCAAAFTLVGTKKKVHGEIYIRHWFQQWRREFSKCIATVYRQSKQANVTMNLQFQHVGVWNRRRCFHFSYRFCELRGNMLKKVKSPVLSFRSKRWLKLKMVMGYSASKKLVGKN